MKKKALIIASVASMLDNFNRNNIEILQRLGYKVTVAGNFRTNEDINSQEKIDLFAREMREKKVNIAHIDFSRNIRKIGMQFKSILQVRKLLEKRFDLIHCHSPICAAIVRYEAEKYRRKYETRIIYTAHGFHFFAGAPMRNWLFYYPVEKWMSRYTDTLITINREDYNRAKEYFYAKRTVYVPGIGIDIDKFFYSRRQRIFKRSEFGLDMNDILLLSVGELNSNKNHELGIRALVKMRNDGEDISRFHYYICGIGRLEEYLKTLILDLKLSDNVHLLGYREDISEIYGAADIFLFMSKREGLPVSLMEAMASGLPSIVTDVRGNVDLIRDGEEGYIVDYDPSEVADAIHECLSESVRNNMSKNALKRIKHFGQALVNAKMRKIYNN